MCQILLHKWCIFCCFMKYKMKKNVGILSKCDIYIFLLIYVIVKKTVDIKISIYIHINRHKAKLEDIFSLNFYSLDANVPNPPSVPPSWIEAPRDTSVTLGGSVVVPCHAHGSPTPKVTWRRTRGEYLCKEVGKEMRLESEMFMFFCPESAVARTAREFPA